MKASSILFLVLAGFTQLFGQNASVEVIVKNIRDTKGNIRIGLFDKEKDFLKTPLHGKIVSATGSDVTVVFENLPPGDYAISVIHDENENGELDSNKLGIPKEGFGFGNNASGNFGPPSFDKVKIKLSGKNVTQVIDLKYL